MATIIRYNGVNPFGTRTPEVSKEELLESPNGYISNVERYTISGTRPRPSCNAGFTAYYADMEYILSSFKDQFKTFEIVENGVPLVTKTNCIIRSVSFPESSYVSFYEYEIVIDFFKTFDNLGVVEPEETYETSQEDSSITTLRHTISCRGVGPNAYLNAKAFLDLRIANFFVPTIVGKANVTVSPVLLSRVYSENKFTGEYSVVTTYTYDAESTQYGTLVYTTELSETPEGTVITISGEIQVAAVNNIEMDKARLRFNQIDWQALAQSEWQKWGGTTTLGENVTFSVNENPLTGQVSFSLTWNTTSQEGPYLQETLTVSQGLEATCMSYRALVRADHGCVGQRFAEVEAYFNATNFRARALTLWNLYGTGETLSPEARALTITRNEFAGTTSVELTLCHDSAFSCGCAENMNFSLEFVEPIDQYAAQPVLRGLGRYIIQDLGFKNRRKFSIRGAARRAKCCTIEQAISGIKTRLNFLSFQYFPASDKILELAQIDRSDSGDAISFNYSWSGAA